MFDGVQGTRFGVEMVGRASVTAIECSFLDHRGAAFAAWANCDEASFNTSKCIVKGQVWRTEMRPGGVVIEEGLHSAPPMSIPGREDSRWPFPEDIPEFDLEGGVQGSEEDAPDGGTEENDEYIATMVPESGSECEEVKENVARLSRALSERAAEGREVGPEEFEGFAMKHFDARKMWLRDIPEWQLPLAKEVEEEEVEGKKV